MLRLRSALRRAKPRRKNLFKRDRAVLAKSGRIQTGITQCVHLSV